MSGALADKIRMIRESMQLKQDEFAEQLGTTQGTVSRWEKGAQPKPSQLAAIAALGKMSVETLLGAEAVLAPPPSITVLPASENVITLRSFDLSFAMGPGTNIDDYVEEGTFDFDAGMLKSITRTHPDLLFVARGDGDSMFPTLVNDDLVIIDTSQKVLNLQDRIWACSVYGAGAIKRLRSMGGGKVLVKSDNPTIGDQEVEADELTLVGRVIWLGRRI